MAFIRQKTFNTGHIDKNNTDYHTDVRLTTHLFTDDKTTEVTNAQAINSKGYTGQNPRLY